MTGGGGSSMVAPLYAVTPVATIQRRLNAGSTVSYTDGNDIYTAASLAQAADAVVALDLTLAYNVKTAPQSFQVDAKPFGTLPVGIPVPKKDPQLRDAVQGALKKVIASGRYDELLAKWNLQSQALKDASINSGT